MRVKDSEEEKEGRGLYTSFPGTDRQRCVVRGRSAVTLQDESEGDREGKRGHGDAFPAPPAAGA